MDYWEECVSEACDDCGLIITKEQIECIAGWVEGAECWGIAAGSSKTCIEPAQGV